MLEIEFHLQAEAEMLDAAAYYEERATGLGSDFLDDIASEKIFIVAVAHLRRKPGYWKTRE